MRVINDNAQIDVQIDGKNGDAIVLLSGFPLSRAVWNAQVEVLSANYRVIRPDLRGLGASSVPDGPYLMETLAGDIAAVLDALGLERVALAGHSLGGFVAVAFARMYSERLSHLALICSRLNADSPEMARTRYELANRAEAGESIAPITQWYAPKLLVEDLDAGVAQRAKALMEATSPRGAAAMLRGMAVRDEGFDIAPELELPVLVMAGGKDPLISLEGARATAAAFPDAELVVCESSGHLPMMEEPARVSGALEEWLRR